MLILNRLSRSDRPLAVALGTFDGMHLGHTRLIRSLVGEAERKGLEPSVLTFDRHPMEVLAPGTRPELLTDACQRRTIASGMGLRQWAELPFTEEFASMQPGEFIHRCLIPAGVGLVTVGFNFRFGAGGAGDPEFLERAGKDLGFETVVLEAETIGGEPVSSSRIRNEVKSGSLEGASRMLGRPYALTGETASDVFRPRALFCLPPEGSYAVCIRTGSGRETDTQAILRGGLFYLTGSVPEGSAELFFAEKSPEKTRLSGK